jgi:hypothetical protein
MERSRQVLAMLVRECGMRMRGHLRNTPLAASFQFKMTRSLI